MKSLKVITIGDAGVGKTALTNRFTNNTFGIHGMTIGVDFAIKRYSDGGKIQIWDTAGQESFRSISRSYYRGADAALICFSLNDEQSFLKIMDWYEDLMNVNENCLCVLVGTKCELEHKIEKHNIENLINKMNVNYFECSAKLNMYCDLPFKYIYDNATQNIETQVKQGTWSKQNTCC